MEAIKIRQFLELAGQRLAPNFEMGDEATRKLGAQLLLSELLEYIIRGLKVIPEYKGTAITDPESFTYKIDSSATPDKEEMLDGLADVAYTMFWNSESFGIPLEAAFDLVCDNNLEKFVKLEDWDRGELRLEQSEWHCNLNVTWPAEVTDVEVKKVAGKYFAVGKDARGKVRKPSCYKSVDLSALLV